MKTTSFAFLSLALCCALAAQADTFGSGLNTFDIDFVTIGNPGNAADTTGNPSPPHPTGSVGYAFRMGQFEISEDMIDKANALGSLGITKNSRGPDKPATSVSWLEATKFVNWLNTSTNNTPAYKFDGGGSFQLWQPGDAGYDPNNRFRNSQAMYFLPSVDEWYKAAYYNGDTNSYGKYPTANGNVPTPVSSGTTVNTAVYGQSQATGPADITLAGGLSPYGTMGQGGNASEWEETEFDLVNNSVSASRGLRRGHWYKSASYLSSSDRYVSSPGVGFNTYGFRVASIPEPSSILLGVLASLGMLMWRRRTS